MLKFHDFMIPISNLRTPISPFFGCPDLRSLTGREKNVMSPSGREKISDLPPGEKKISDLRLGEKKSPV